MSIKHKFVHTTHIPTNQPNNYVPSKANIFFRDDEDFIGSVYKKAVYREYTDASFTNRKSVDVRDVHKDLLGPIIRAEVGDVIIIHFKNMASRPYNMHPRGLKYR